MATVNVPAVGIWTKKDLIPPAINQVNRSDWTGGRKVVRLPGSGIWRGSFALAEMTRELYIEPWRAFLAVIEGTANHFLVPVSWGQQTAAANATVGAGAVAGAQTMPVAGMPANQTYLRGGQFIDVTLPSGDRQLLLLTLPLVAGAGGTGVATFRGALREAPIAGAAVEARFPKCQMAMVEDQNAGWTDSNGSFIVAFDAEEAFNGPA